MPQIPQAPQRPISLASSYRAHDVTASVDRLREWLAGDFSEVGGLARAHVHTLVEITPRLLQLAEVGHEQAMYAIALQRVCEAMRREARHGDGHLTPATVAAAPHHAAMLADVTALREERARLLERLDTPAAPRVHAAAPAERPVDLALFAQNVAELTWLVAQRHPFHELSPQQRLAVQDQITAVATAVTALESGDGDAQQRVQAIEWSDAREQLAESILRSLGDRVGAAALVEAVYPPAVTQASPVAISA